MCRKPLWQKKLKLAPLEPAARPVHICLMYRGGAWESVQVYELRKSAALARTMFIYQTLQDACELSIIFPCLYLHLHAHVSSLAV